MPRYDYDCPACGRFRAWRAMADSAEKSACPTCGLAAPRAVTAPNLRVVSRNARIAHERNERAAHEPAVMSRQQMERSATHHDHHHQSHHHHHHGDPRRAWMIGH